MEAKNTRPIFPWYKERLQTKYLKAQTNKISSVGSSWRFRNEDFSDRLSASSGPQIIGKTPVLPIIYNGTPNHNSTQKSKKCISKEHACFSKQMVQKQIRREYVAAVEEKFKQHPLAMYPHYKDHMPPELFDKVVSVLGPDMCVNSTSALPTPTGNHVEEENCTELSKEDVDRTKHNKISPVVQSSTPRNPYILQINGNGIKKGQTSKVNPQSTHKNMKVVAKLFSKWFASPDEEINVNLNESAMLGNADSHRQDSSLTFPVQEEDFSFSGHKRVTTTNGQELDFKNL